MVRLLLRVSHRNKNRKENTHTIDGSPNDAGIAHIFPQHFRLESIRHLFEHDARPVQSNKSIPNFFSEKLFLFCSNKNTVEFVIFF